MRMEDAPSNTTWTADKCGALLAQNIPIINKIGCNGSQA
jgi:hypothetical protein